MTQHHALARGAAAVLALLAAQAAQAATATLEGWALMPAATVADGPTTGQFGGTGFGANSGLLPIAGGQSVQGFSAVLAGPSAGSYYFMPDNGFGTQANSADALLRVYALQPDFRTALGGSGTVSAVNYSTGAALAGFSAASQITLSDPNRLIGFPIQADYTRYYNLATNPAVDASIRSGRLLTGADFDIESMRQDKNGNLWFGEEFGPFLLNTNSSGQLLRAPVSLPGVLAPENPLRGSTPANLGSSRGFEGMAINRAGDRLYTLLEGTVTGDPAKTLRINEFNVDTGSFSTVSWSYLLETSGTNIGDMTAVNDHEFLVIERNGGTGTSGTPFKKIFKIDINATDGAGHVKKTEVVDLMAIADPHDLNGDGSTAFTFPYVTIESVLVLDSRHLLVANDNNFPGGGGRSAAPDQTEFLVIGLDQALNVTAVPEPGNWALMLGGGVLLGAALRRRRGLRAG